MNETRLDCNAQERLGLLTSQTMLNPFLLVMLQNTHFPSVGPASPLELLKPLKQDNKSGKLTDIGDRSNQERKLSLGDSAELH